jgi:hypothetical protein
MRSARLSQEAAAPQHSAATTAASVRPLRAIIQAVGPSQQTFSRGPCALVAGFSQSFQAAACGGGAAVLRGAACRVRTGRCGRCYHSRTRR